MVVAPVCRILFLELTTTLYKYHQAIETDPEPIPCIHIRFVAHELGVFLRRMLSLLTCSRKGLIIDGIYLWIFFICVAFLLSVIEILY